MKATSLASAPKASAKPVSEEKGASPESRGVESARESAIANQSIRVGVSVLENLMTIVSELVLINPVASTQQSSPGQPGSGVLASFFGTLQLFPLERGSRPGPRDVREHPPRRGERTV